MAKKLRFALVGLGMASRPHVRGLKDLEAAGVLEVAGVFARDQAKREAFAAANGWRAASSLEALATDKSIDAVLMLTPPNARVELVDLFAANGKAILMEKPVERTTATAEKIVARCEAAKVPLGIVFQHRLKPAARAMRELLDSGRLGKIGLVRLDVPWWRPQSYYDEPGRGTLARDGGGVLISQAIHAMDMMLALTPDVVDVTALAGTTSLHKMETEDFAGAGLRFADGSIGTIVATTANFPGVMESCVFNGDNGSATLDASTLTVQWRDGKTETAGVTGVGTGGGADPMAFDHGPHRDVIADFASAVAEGREPSISGRSALRVHRLIDAILESSRKGARVAVAKGDA